MQMLCARGAQTLQSKSVNVEDAANELIEMLCSMQSEEEEQQEEVKGHRVQEAEDEEDKGQGGWWGRGSNVGYTGQRYVTSTNQGCVTLLACY